MVAKIAGALGIVALGALVACLVWGNVPGMTSDPVGTIDPAAGCSQCCQPPVDEEPCAATSPCCANSGSRAEVLTANCPGAVTKCCPSDQPKTTQVNAAVQLFW
jgi:hypothetical protein